MTPLLRPLALALLIAAAGCAPTGPLVSDPPTGTAAGYPDHTVAQILAAVEASVAPVLSVAADGEVRAVQPDGSDQSASYSLRARLADSASVTVRGPLGIIAARGLLTPDSLFLANVIQDELVIGPLSAADAVVPGASRDGRVVRAALGLLVPDADVAWTLAASDGLYTLAGRLPDAPGNRSYTVDPSIWRVVRVVEFDADGRQVGLQTASDFDVIDGAVLPRRVHLEGEGTTVDLEHRRLVVNPTDLRIRFVRPEGYDVIVLR